MVGQPFSYGQPGVHAPVLPKNINNKYPKNNRLSIYPIPRPGIAENNQFENSPE
jgi:hypothetical protein